jgi:ATP adenylyltransferase
MNGQSIYIVYFYVVTVTGACGGTAIIPTENGEVAMDQVFAPWRIEWVERSGKNESFDGCVFCELPDCGADREHYLLARGEYAYVLLNNYPYNPGHAMIIPHEHTGEYRDLDRESLLAKERLVQRTIDAMEDALEPDGYNVGYNVGSAAAGGSIGDHLHAHVVPRWESDTNFMPVVGDTKVIVEAVTDTYDRLHEAFAAQEGVESRGAEAAVHVTAP